MIDAAATRQAWLVTAGSLSKRAGIADAALKPGPRFQWQFEPSRCSVGSVCPACTPSGVSTFGADLDYVLVDPHCRAVLLVVVLLYRQAARV